MRRRGFLAGVSGLALSTALPLRAAPPAILETEPFGPETVIEMARTLAASEYTVRAEVPPEWRDLTYDQYRRIWFDPRNAVWSDTDLPFRMDLFHPGLYFPRPVEIDVVANGEANRLAFDLALFDKTDDAPDLPDDASMGYSGLRLRYRYPEETNPREFAVFQGASYFRAIGADQQYGLSARGLALRTGDADGEEFPEFIRFWVETPGSDDTAVIVHALLDSPSVAGAYRFEIEPGPACLIRVEATLFPRVDLDHVGLAPLTSMFLYDETNRSRFDDFRPGVHDSDGLLIWNGVGEMLWRPLANPRALGVSGFVDDGLRGFGLMQRSRKLSDFADLEAHYQDRPSLWIAPEGDWGPGIVRLVEIPSDKEIYDNIVAYWRPHEPILAGSEHRYAYNMIWGDERATDAPIPRGDVARVMQTYIGANFNRDGQVVAIDYAEHPRIGDPLEDITVRVSADLVEPSEGVLQHNSETGGTRLTFGFDPEDNEALEFRAQLFREGEAVSEVWLYRWTSS
ncbi:glucan biosynthesis protein G [uncultured Jannaschia sp.]|uniref:glucan biosynthesis protein n=1 Tax=uncultured Jannaschia sp. TaxID=293347 RepID=UPI00260897BC|nr:glucan biosynthesis protein G [uncultured Jannaschia sp.]